MSNVSAVTRRRALSEQTRREVLDAAREAFGRLGYEAASIGVIAKAARVTSGALYHHFADKPALFAAVAEQIEADLMVELAKAGEGATGPWEQLEAAALFTLEHLLDAQIRQIVLVDAPKVLGAAAWRAVQMRYGLGMATAALQGLADAGLARTADPAVAAQMLLAALFQGAEAAARAPDPQAALEPVQRDLLTLMRAFRA
ncbi:MAG: tetC [Caulobacter sp.]|nr:tetC [Caulobacter sp.]